MAAHCKTLEKGKIEVVKVVFDKILFFFGIKLKSFGAA